MRAVILAAGRGMRLRSETELPKCLFAPGGVALIERYVSALDALALRATVVTGYRHELVAARLAAIAPRFGFTTIVNPEFHLGSIVSLARGLEGVHGPVVLMDGDVLFHPDLLARLVQSPAANALLVDEGAPFTGEEYMAGVDAAGRVRELRRAAVPGHERSGEWVGFAKLSGEAVAELRAAIARQIAAGETAGGYEDSLAALLAATEFASVPTQGLPWIEIDFPDDATAAEEIIRAGKCG